MYGRLTRGSHVNRSYLFSSFLLFLKKQRGGKSPRVRETKPGISWEGWGLHAKWWNGLLVNLTRGPHTLLNTHLCTTQTCEKCVPSPSYIPYWTCKWHVRPNQTWSWKSYPYFFPTCFTCFSEKILLKKPFLHTNILRLSTISRHVSAVDRDCLGV